MSAMTTTIDRTTVRYLTVTQPITCSCFFGLVGDTPCSHNLMQVVEWLESTIALRCGKISFYHAGSCPYDLVLRGSRTPSKLKRSDRAGARSLVSPECLRGRNGEKCQRAV